LLTGPKRPAVSNATPDPLDQHEITITGRQKPSARSRESRVRASMEARSLRQRWHHKN
jgi:hypothetical protein